MKPFHATWEKLETVDGDGVVETMHAMVPSMRFAHACEEEFKIGDRFTIDAIPYGEDERTDKEHKAFFASVNEAWLNLPEAMHDEYPTAEHLRKRSLIRTGHHTVKAQPFETHKQALVVAAFIRPLEEFDYVKVVDNVVFHYRAKSQAYKRAGGMGKEEFRKSRDDVLADLARLIEVTKSELAKQGERPPA